MIASCVLSLSLAVSAFAQEKIKSDAQPEKIEVKTIFAYKKELNITDKQEKDLKDILAKFQNYLVEKRREIANLSSELADMIKKKDSLKAIRAKIDKVARLQADASYTDVETSRKVEGILTAAQISKWKKFQEEFQKELQEKMKETQAKQQQNAGSGKNP